MWGIRLGAGMAWSISEFRGRNPELGRGQRAEGIGDFGLRILDFVMSEGQRDFGPPWRDLIEKYLYRGDVSEKKPVEIWLFKTGLGQGLRPRETGSALME